VTRAKRMLVGAAIGAMVGTAFIGLRGADLRAASALGRIAELIGYLIGWALIPAVIALFVRPKQRATPAELDRERDDWSDEEKETIRNLMNKRD